MEGSWRGVLVILGGILLHLSLGTLYTFGNISLYMTSYMRQTGSQSDLTYTQCTWVFALACIGQGCSMPFGGLLAARIGPKLTTLIGGWCMSLGVLLTYFTVKVSFIATVLTYGLVFGIGVGIAYSSPLACAMRWFPEHKGLVNGLVLAGFGGGAFIFDQIQTAFINPNNLIPDNEQDGVRYFSNPELLDKVPKTFILMGACYAVMQLVGSMLLCFPPKTEITVLFAKAEKSEQDKDKLLLNDQLLLKDNRRPDLNSTDDNNDLHPLQVLRNKHFYFIWLMFLSNGQASFFVSTLYKAYGQTFIFDDKFLALVGAFAAVFNALGRIMWGFIADRFSFRVSMLIMTTCMTCLMLTLKVTELGGRGLFFVYICFLFGSFCGSYSLFPTVTAKCFGKKYMAINYGLVFTSQAIAALLGVMLAGISKASLGWTGMFFLCAGFTFLSLILAFFFSAKDKDGKEI